METAAADLGEFMSLTFLITMETTIIFFKFLILAMKTTVALAPVPPFTVGTQLTTATTSFFFY